MVGGSRRRVGTCLSGKFPRFRNSELRRATLEELQRTQVAWSHSKSARSRILPLMAHTYILTAFAFLIGLIAGSFLNVCIVRLPADESVVRPRSKCPACKAPVRAADNIPLVSWLLLRGRCRSCKGPISLQYPIVELLMGLWFAAQFLRYSEAMAIYMTAVDFFGISASRVFATQTELVLEYLAMAALGFLLLGLMVMDWQTGLLPNEFTYGGMFTGLLLYAIAAFTLPEVRGVVMLTAPEKAIALRLAAILASALVLLLVRWIYWKVRHSEGMGLGDVKMLAMIAAFLGLRLAMLSLFFGVVSGALFAVGLVLVLRLKKVVPAHPDSPGVTTPTPLHPAHMHVPFGSFLAGGGLYAALFGHQTMDWYLRFWR